MRRQAKLSGPTVDSVFKTHSAQQWSRKSFGSKKPKLLSCEPVFHLNHLAVNLTLLLLGLEKHNQGKIVRERSYRSRCNFWGFECLLNSWIAPMPPWHVSHPPVTRSRDPGLLCISRILSFTFSQRRYCLIIKLS